MPKTTARDVASLLQARLGDFDDEAKVLDALERLFGDELLRSQGKEAELAASVLYELKETARIAFDEK